MPLFKHGTLHTSRSTLNPENCHFILFHAAGV